ncbi:helix-turn-helix domain-containing protein [Flavobacterium daejeonense]|uniref:helix-turn-helix domain-containing protein n=1 Tax=Flavobacterium daejeonense TaxID=350893 RepID=UPI0004797FDE|nr:helix-turn-helix transcriptional regulator [Flavobacterium daejeonense]
MKINETIKAIRRIKYLSQSYIANELNLDQSQYCRREKGEIQFTPSEIVKLSKLLEVSIAELFGEKIIESQRIKEINEELSVAEKLIEQYECRIKEKDEMIFILKQMNERKTNR